MWRYIFFCLIVFSTNSSLSQTEYQKNEERLHVILKPSANGMMLRWAPTTPGLWLRMHRAEFVVMRQSWFPGQFDDDGPQVISDTLRVWPDEEFDNWKDHELVMLAGYTMHAPYETLQDEKRTLSLMVDQEQELNNRFSSALFAAERDTSAAKSQAMFYHDNSVNLEQKSVYTIRMKMDQMTYTASVFYDPEDSHSMVPEITKWSEEEELVVLSWDKKSHEAHFSSYYIERSRDGIKFDRLTDHPYVHAFDMNQDEQDGDFVYMDSVTNYIPYYYRIIGLDAFGEESTPSPAQRLMGRDRTPPALPLESSAAMHLDKFMQVKWKNVSPDVATIRVKKSALYDGTYVEYSNALSAQDTVFFDLAPDYLGPNFYKICVMDSVDNEACTSPILGRLNDTIPPSPPIGLKGVIDTNGVVQLSWDMNNEIDMKGYKVYFSNRYDGVFSVLTGQYLTDTFFVDTITINTLTEDVFYRVVAVDIRNNMSNFSDFNRLVKPDIIPPGPPVFTSYFAKGEKIGLEWAPSETHDVVAHELYRRAEDGSWIKIADFNRKSNTYSDINIEAKRTYQYRIIAVDDSGLKSKHAKDIRVKSPLKIKQAEVTLTFLEEEGDFSGKVELKGTGGAIDKVFLYRVNNSIKSTFKVLEEEDLPYTFPTNSQDYVIRVFYENGEKSPFLAKNE